MIAPKIALISAVTAAIAPAEAALRAYLPEATVWNILDDRLLIDADSEGGLTEGLRLRMTRLINHAVAEEADAILLTCSLYGPVAQGVHATIPVLAPDQSVFSDIIGAGYGSVLVVASFEAARDDSVERLRSAISDSNSLTRVTGLAIPRAMKAAKAADRAELLAALLDGCRLPSAESDAVFLAQYSLAPASDDLQAALGIPVHSGPKSAAIELERRLSKRAPA